MNWIYLLVFCVGLYESEAQDLNGCAAFFEDPTFWKSIILLSKMDKTQNLNESYPLTKQIRISSFTNTDDEHPLLIPSIDPGPEDGSFSLAIRSSFDDLDLYYSQTSPTMSISLTVSLICNEDNPSPSSLQFLVDITDVNTHDPDFANTDYTFLVPNPLPPKIDLTGFGDQVLATDLDFSNTNITFEVVPNDSGLWTAGSESIDAKTYKASLKLASFLQLTEDITLTLQSTDTGSPPRSATTTVTFKVDPSNVFVAGPSFSESSYRLKYVVDDSSESLTSSDGNSIQVSAADDVEVKVDDTTYFDVDYDSDTQTFQIKITNAITTLNADPVAALILTATSKANGDSTTALVLIDIPNVANIPTFSKPAYFFNYSADSLTGTEDITVIVNGIAGFNVLIEDNPYFTYTFDSNTGAVSLSPQSLTAPAPTSVVTVIASTYLTRFEAQKNQATISIQFPADALVSAPKFTAPFYTAQYIQDSDSLDTVILDTPVEVDTADATVSLEGEKASNFHISYSDSNWLLSVNNDLKESDFIHGKVVLTLVARLASNSEETRVFLEIQANTNVQFKEHSYTATYEVSNGSGSIKLNGIISCDYADSIEIVDSYEKNFNIDSSSYVITAAELLNLTSIETNVLIVELYVSLTGTNKTDKTVISFTLPTPEPLAFSSPSYVMTYNIDSTTLDGTITLENAQADVSVSVVDNEDFVVENNADNSYSVKAVNSLNSSVLDIQTDMLLVLHASQTSRTSIDAVYATVLVNLPKKVKITAPDFEHELYVGTYSVDGSDTVDLDTPIASRTDSAIISLSETQSDPNAASFEFDPTDNTIKVKTPLNSSILNDVSDIILTLETKVDGIEGVGLANVVIRLPKEQLPASFTQSIFAEAYNAEDASITGDDITLTEPNRDDTSVELSGDKKDLFEVDTTSYPYKLKVKSALGDDDLKSGEIVLILEAKRTDSTAVNRATILVSLPELPKAPAFSSSVYEGVYTPGADPTLGTISITDTITTTDDGASVVVTTLEPYVENFELKYDSDSKSYTIEVLADLSQADIDAIVDYIYVRFEATIGLSLPSTIVVALRLPVKASDVVPTFNNAYYTGSYNASSTIVTIDGTIQITSDHSDETVITIADPYSEYFQCVSTDNIWSIVTNSALPPSILDSNLELYLTLVAKLDSSSKTGSAVFVLSLPAQVDVLPLPKFSETYYTAVYTIDGEPKIALDKPITFTGSAASRPVLTLEDHEENFKPRRNDDNVSWDLDIGSALDDTTLKTKTEIAVKLRGQIEDASDYAVSTLLVSLPSTVAQNISFSAPFYQAQYLLPATDTDLAQLDFKTSIDIQGDSATVALQDGGYSKYFNVTCASSTCTLSVVLNLPSTDLGSIPQIILVLLATLEDSPESASATVIVNLPLAQSADGLKFDKSVYTATYVDENTVTGPSIKIENISPEEVTLALTSDGKDVTEFSLEVTDDYWELKTTGLTIDELNAVSMLLTVEATLKTDDSIKGTTTIVVNLPKSTDSAPTFTADVYYANYSGTDISLDTPIALTNPKIDISTVNLTLSATYFELTKSTDHWEITNVAVSADDLEQILLKVDVTAEIPDVLLPAQTTVIVTLPKKYSSTTIYFEKNYYEASYNGSATEPLSISGDIKISRDDTSDVAVQVIGAYKDNFLAKYESGLVTISTTDPLNDAVLSSNAVIVIDIQASKDVDLVTAAIVTKLPYTPETESAPKFKNDVYSAKYENGAVTLDEQIELENSEIDLKSAVFELDQAGNYFRVNVDDNDQLTISTDTLSDTVIESSVVLILKIAATLPGYTLKAETAVVIQLPKKYSPTFVYFEDNVYYVDYAEGLEFADIKIINDDDSSANIAIIGDYTDYFDVKSYADNVLTIELTKPLAQDILDTNSVAVVTISAEKDSETAVAALIVKLLNGTKDIPKFTSEVYNGAYIDSTTKIISLDKDLALEGSNVDLSNVVLEISPSDNYAFSTRVNDKHWDLVVDKIDDTVLDSEVVLVLTVSATIKDKAYKAETVIVVTLPRKVSPTSFYFEDTIYYGEYTHDTTDSVTIDKAINIVNDDAQAAVITITGAYATYFAQVYSDNAVTITLSEALPEDVLNKNAAVSITLRAKIDTEETVAAVVVNLPKTDAEIPQFTEEVYNGKYDSSTDIIPLDNELALEDTTINTTTVNLDIISAATYSFTTKLNDDHWDLVVESLDATVIDSEIALVLTAVATIAGKTSPAKSVIVVTLPKKVSPTSFYFEDQIYMGEYTHDTTDSITIDKAINIVNDDSYAATVTITGSYAEYFNQSYDEGTVTITLVKNLPDDVLENNAAVLINLVAEKDDEKPMAAVIFKLPKTDDTPPDGSTTAKPVQTSTNDCSNTGLIAAVSVLAVLLAATIVGSVVFYFLKFRRASSNYSNMEEPKTEHFRRNSNSGETNRFDRPPTRRDTSIIKYPLSGEDVTESTTDEDPIERRKSVQFDVVNIDELAVEPVQVEDDEDVVNNILRTLASQEEDVIDDDDKASIL